LTPARRSLTQRLSRARRRGNVQAVQGRPCG
jgi:hypothetical protein